jgi:hypothetical protein
MLKKTIAWVSLDNHATIAGSRRRAVPMAVSLLYLHHAQLFRIIVRPGCCCPQEVVMKEEPKTPANLTTKKCKLYSSTDANPIRTMDLIDVDFDSAPLTRKHVKSASGGTAQVQFNGVAVPRQTRKSMHAKAIAKKDVNELFEQLAQEYAALSKTFQALSECHN